METWNYRDERVLEMKMEDVTAAAEERFAEIVAFLGLESGRESGGSNPFATALNVLYARSGGRFPFRVRQSGVSRGALDKVVHKNRFGARSGGRKKGQEDAESHYRKGVPGDWKNHFTDKHVNTFMERHGGLLRKLEYEE
jgi:hypothetical protein